MSLTAFGRDEDTQLVSLRIVRSLAPKITAEEMWLLMPALTNFRTHPSSVCRQTMLDCLMWIYDNYRYASCCGGTFPRLSVKFIWCLYGMRV